MTTDLDLDELRRLAEAAGVREKPWELYEGGDFTYSIFGRHPGEEYDDENLPCRITTGGDFDDLDSARLAVAAVNALPRLLDMLAEARSEGGPLDVERLARALIETESYIDFTKRWSNPDSYLWVARQVAAEYARLTAAAAEGTDAVER